MVTDETLKHYRNKITYAQNREDLLLESFFLDKKDGFYVDVGGYDPDEDSVTRLFYTRGWNGINIEPQPKQYEKFTKRRPRDININAAVSDRAGVLNLRVYKSGGLSTLSSEVKDLYASTHNDLTDSWEDIKVRLQRLDTILDKANVKNIDFMKIDVEGFEVQVLNSNNWKKYRPNVICIEAGVSVRQTRRFLKQIDYMHVFNDGLNDYYIDKQWGKFDSLPYIDHILIRRGGGIRYEDYDNARKLYLHNKRVEKRLDEALEREERLRTENLRLKQTLNDKKAMIRKTIKLYAGRTSEDEIK